MPFRSQGAQAFGVLVCLYNEGTVLKRSGPAGGKLHYLHLLSLETLAASLTQCFLGLRPAEWDGYTYCPSHFQAHMLTNPD